MTKCNECEEPAEYIYYGARSGNAKPLCTKHLDVALEWHFQVITEEDE